MYIQLNKDDETPSHCCGDQRRHKEPEEHRRDICIGHCRAHSPWPTPIPPISRAIASCVNTSRTMPFALHWYRRPLGPHAMIPHASWPRCCSSDRPSQISGAAFRVGSCRRRPRIPHTVDGGGKREKGASTAAPRKRVSFCQNGKREIFQWTLNCMVKSRT